MFGKYEAILLLFLLFVIFFGNIVIMNVFTGLAVGDVAIAMSEAENIQARYQMKLVANVRAHQYFKETYFHLTDFCTPNFYHNQY
mgnify:CR=1 FL=1